MTASPIEHSHVYGMLLNISVAAVPGFSPIGEDANWYWAHLGTAPGQHPEHPAPASEVLAYHQDRWSHVTAYDGFIDFLSFHHFSAAHIAELAAGAGMTSLIATAKHNDGFCWWDAPFSHRTSLRSGPQRNVLAEVAQACRTQHLTFGCAYSLVDWADPRYPNRPYVEQVVEPQVLDLVGRYGAEIVLANPGGGRAAGVDLDATALIDRARALAEVQGHDVVFDDGWGTAELSLRTRFYDAPAGIDHEPWQLIRGLGPSLGYNRNEGPEHIMTAGGLLDLLTEVVAKGGRLTVSVGLTSAGSIPGLVAQPLRDVGAWLAEHDDFIAKCSPFDHWGDAQTRLLRCGDEIVAIDLSGASQATFTGIDPHRYRVHDVRANATDPVRWHHDRDGLAIERVNRAPRGLAALYRFRLQENRESTPFYSERPLLSEATADIAGALTAARPGEVVELPDGVHAGPLYLPAGVTLRGRGWQRSIISADANGVCVVLGAPGSRLEQVRVDEVQVTAADCAVVDCRIDGTFAATGDRALIDNTTVETIVISGDQSAVNNCRLGGTPSAIGIHIIGGGGHRISGCELHGHRSAIVLVGADNSLVTANSVSARLSACELRNCQGVQAIDNSVAATMRAFTVSAGSGVVIGDNIVSDGDTACLVECGAVDTRVVGNRADRCRLGVLVWDSPSTVIGTNSWRDIAESDTLRGPTDEWRGE